jgi:hypothetical protein
MWILGLAVFPQHKVHSISPVFLVLPLAFECITLNRERPPCTSMLLLLVRMNGNGWQLLLLTPQIIFLERDGCKVGQYHIFVRANQPCRMSCCFQNYGQHFRSCLDCLNFCNPPSPSSNWKSMAPVMIKTSIRKHRDESTTIVLITVM